MKQKIFIIALTALCLFSVRIYSQKISKQILSEQENVPKFIKFEPETTLGKGSELEVLHKNLKLTKNDKFLKLQEYTDKYQTNHVKYQQYYKGVKVEFGIYNQCRLVNILS